MAVTSNTGVVTGTGPFTVTFPLHYQSKKVFLYVDYTKVTGGSTITLGMVNPKIGNTNAYQETLFATANAAPITVTLTAASGRFRFELTPSYNETNLVVIVTIAGTDSAVVDLGRE